MEAERTLAALQAAGKRREAELEVAGKSREAELEALLGDKEAKILNLEASVEYLQVRKEKGTKETCLEAR